MNKNGNNIKYSVTYKKYLVAYTHHYYCTSRCFFLCVFVFGVVSYVQCILCSVNVCD